MRIPQPLGPLALAAAGLAPSCITPVDGYDPYEGMDPNGRIERPELPDDVPNPERWRYTPEGRLPPGNLIDRLFVSSFISPILFREEDIGFGGGVGITDIDFLNSRGKHFANIFATYSEEGQQVYRVDWSTWLHHRELETGGIIRDERSRLNAFGEYSRTLTRRFFGFGSDTEESNETSYTENLATVGVNSTFSVPEAGSDLLMSTGLSYQHHRLGRGRVSSVPSTGDVPMGGQPGFPALFDGDRDVGQLWLSGGLAYDTRDSLHQPYSGWRVGLGAAVAAQTDRSAGALATLDASIAFTLPPLFHDGGDADETNPPTDVLAFGGHVVESFGDLPYYSLPSLGGARTLRGYIQNRFTDTTAAHGSAEYRFAIVPRGVRLTDTVRIERLGLALFYDFGTVADGLEDVFDNRYLDSYGVGLRVAFAREALFRIDVGFSDEDAILTIEFGHSF